MPDLSVAHKTEKSPTGTLPTTADELAEELQREIAWLKFDSLPLTATSDRLGLANVVSSVATATGADIGRRALKSVRRDPLPTAAAIGGVSWFVINMIARGSDRPKPFQGAAENSETDTRHRRLVPAMGLMLGIGAIVGARIGSRKNSP